MAVTHTTQFATLDEVVQHEMERWKVPGISVGILRDGEITGYGYGVTSLESEQKVTSDTLFQIGSNSKVFTTTLLMTLVDDGTVDLDAPVTRYLPDLQLGDARALEALRVRHLVSHQSGLFGDIFDDMGWGDDALAKSVAGLGSARHMYQPTELWSYTNIAFNIAGRIIETVLEQPFETAMRERVLAPLGLERTFYFAHEVYPYRHAVGHRPEKPGDEDVIVAREYWLNRALGPAGSLHSTVHDILTFDRFHLGLGGGERDGKPILSEASRLAMQQPQIKAANFVDEWCLGWWSLSVDGARIIGHGGGTNGFITRNTLIADRQAAFAIFTNSTRGGSAIRPIERWIFAHEFGLHDRDPELVELAPVQIGRVAGEYRNPLSTVTVTPHDGGLRIQIQSTNIATNEPVTHPPVDVKPVSELEFMATEGEQEGSRIDFIPNPDGSIRFVRMGGRLAERA
jgi:CubicO group peptidase (beta-lactamase class C family)